jgi:hypothetical protein
VGRLACGAAAVRGGPAGLRSTARCLWRSRQRPPAVFSRARACCPFCPPRTRLRTRTRARHGHPARGASLCSWHQAPPPNTRRGGQAGPLFHTRGASGGSFGVRGLAAAAAAWAHGQRHSSCLLREVLGRACACCPSLPCCRRGDALRVRVGGRWLYDDRAAAAEGHSPPVVLGPGWVVRRAEGGGACRLLAALRLCLALPSRRHGCRARTPRARPAAFAYAAARCACCGRRLDWRSGGHCWQPE